MIWKVIFPAILAGIGTLADSPEQTTKQCNTILKDPFNSLFECGVDIINPDTIDKEMENAKANMTLHEVTKKYCTKSPELTACITSLATSLQSCSSFSSVAGEFIQIFHMYAHIVDFACYGDGTRLALFIAEDGPECVQEKKASIDDCFTSSQLEIMESMALRALPADRSEQYDELTECIVRALEGCRSPAVGYMAKSLLRSLNEVISSSD